MKGDFHVRFRENVGVKFPCVTRLGNIKKMSRKFETVGLCIGWFAITAQFFLMFQNRQNEW